MAKTKIEQEADDFRTWFLVRRQEWMNFKHLEGSLLTFSEYLLARESFLKEKDNG